MTLFEKAVVGVLLLCGAAIVAINILTAPGDTLSMTPLSTGGKTATGGATGGTIKDDDDIVGDGSLPAGADTAAATDGAQPAFADGDVDPVGETVIANLYVNINAASAAELETLPGVGPVMAGRIIEYRDRYGPFASVDALANVSGIGQKTLDKLRPYLTVE